MTSAVLVFAGLVLAWRLVGAVLSSDRGIDPTDDALYLLAADPPSRTASWNVPWGWHTRPLFVLVGEDIARFRTAGALIVMAGGAFAAVMAVMATIALGPSRVASSLRHVALVFAAIVGACGVAFLYSDLLRTPAYNWVNLVGITIAVGGFCGTIGQPARLRGRVARLGWPAVTAVGLFVTMPAKPSTAPILLVLFSIGVAMAHGFDSALRCVRDVAALVLVIVPAAIATGFWPWGLGRTVARTVSLPPLDPLQNVGRAIWEFLTIPIRIGDEVIGLSTRSLVVLGSATVLALIGSGASVPKPISRWMSVTALALCVVVALRTGAVGLPGLPVVKPAARLNLAMTTTAAMILVFGGVLVALPAVGRSLAREPWRPRLQTMSLPFVLVVAPFVFGFGSANTPYRQASMAVVLLLVAALCFAVSHALKSPISGACAMALVVVATLSLATVTIAESRDHPYRTLAIGELTVPVRFGSDGSTLFVQPELADQIESLRAAAAAGGWRTGMPMVTVMYRWSSMVPYALDADVPDSLMLTLFGYPRSLRFADRNVDDLDVDRFRDAWIVVDDPALIEPDHRALIDEVITLVEDRLDREFPEDYVCAAALNGVRLWRPADGSPAMRAADCT